MTDKQIEDQIKILQEVAENLLKEPNAKEKCRKFLLDAGIIVEYPNDPIPPKID